MTTVISIRIDTDQKERLRDAARMKGVTMTRFILDAADKAAAVVSRRPPAVSGPCPTFFRTMIESAQIGGYGGYNAVGYELSRHVAKLVDDEDAIVELAGYLRRREPLAYKHQVRRWLERNLPSCEQLVPPRRYPSFVGGMCRFEKQHGILGDVA